jgi:DNA-binding PucR family transcriptional regulator
VYLTCRCRLREAARQLDIHRNTLQYRLDRIAQLAGASLEDRDTRVSMELGLWLLELREGRRRSP